MSASLVFAVALMMPQGAPAPIAPAEPEMRVVVGDLDFARPADQDRFVERVRAASRAFCAEHLEIVTPDRLGDPAVCRIEMRRLAYRALPEAQRQQLASAGRFRAIR